VGKTFKTPNGLLDGLRIHLHGKARQYPPNKIFQIMKAMEPEAVLREQHDNFAIEHNGITRIKCWKNSPPARQKSNFELLNKYTYDIELETRQGKMKYTVDDHDPSSELSKGFGSKYH